MKKGIVCLLIAAAATASLSGCGCSMSGQPKPTEAPAAAKIEPTLFVYGEYALMGGFSLYTSPDGAYSIQIPEGSIVNGADPAATSVTLAGAFANPDTITITKDMAPRMIDSTTALLELLKDDNSIDITGFYVLNRDGSYAGYKYTYTAMDDPQLKGITSVYLSSDGTAYNVTAKIYNGGDETNVTAINTIVDTFANHS